MDIPCTTPSQPHPIPNGVSHNIFKTLERTNNGDSGPQVRLDPPATTDILVTLSGTSKTMMQSVLLVLKAQQCQSVEDVWHTIELATSPSEQS